MKNKENTKRKLLDAVGIIIKKDGFSGLGVNKVARAAGVSKILIYRYFGGFTELVRSYILDKDYWKNYLSDEQKDLSFQLTVREQVSRMLSEQSNKFYNHCEMEAMLINEISRHNDMVKRIVREESVPVKQTYRNVVSSLLRAGTDHLLITERDSPKSPKSESPSVKKSRLMQSIGKIVEWTLG